MKGTLFGSVHSGTHLHLIQQSLEVGPASPKTKLVDIPGGSGSVDLTEVAETTPYADRTLKWTFALFPGDNWPQKRSTVSNALNGKRLQITPDNESGWYYDGRVSVTDHKSDKIIHQITVQAVCAPYKRKTAVSTVTAALTDEFSDVTCAIGQMPLVPQISVEQDTVIVWGEYTAAVSAGTHLLPELFMSGTQVIQAKATDGTGTITVTWREGSL